MFRDFQSGGEKLEGSRLGACIAFKTDDYCPYCLGQLDKGKKSSEWGFKNSGSVWPVLRLRGNLKADIALFMLVSICRLKRRAIVPKNCEGTLAN